MKYFDSIKLVKILKMKNFGSDNLEENVNKYII